MNKANVEYITCVLFDDYSLDDELKSWPLHITLVPWFAPDDIVTFKENFVDLLKHDHQISVVVGEEKTWGPNTVNVIEYSQPLHDMHRKALKLIETSGRLLINKQYTGENYTPHITHQKSLAKQPGDNVLVKNIYIIERDTKTKRKKVITKVTLAA